MHNKHFFSSLCPLYDNVSFSIYKCTR